MSNVKLGIAIQDLLVQIRLQVFKSLISMHINIFKWDYNRVGKGRKEVIYIYIFLPITNIGIVLPAKPMMWHNEVIYR